MDTMSAFAMGEANRGEELMIFDWVKAAKRIKETGCKNASAGLSGDWDWTGGTILNNGKLDLDSYTYLASTWAIPELDLDGEIEDCYVMKSERPEWGAHTKWPDEAKKVFFK